MYIKLKLIKAINNYYFRTYTDSHPKAISLKSTQDDLVVIRETAIEYKDIELKDMVEDLFDELFTDIQQHKYKSQAAQDALVNLITKSNAIKMNLKFTSPTSKEVMDLLNINSMNSYIVGGFNRDILMNKFNKDIDFVTDSDLGTLEAIFTSSGFKVQHEGKQFLVMIVSKGGEQFEIANFRKDTDNSGGVPGNIYEDAQRRDFTCNALYFNLNTQILKDPNGTGINDLELNTLKFVGNPKERIVEDPNRVFRFYRFINKGFTADPKSLRAVRENFDYAIKNTSSERIRLEIERIVI